MRIFCLSDPHYGRDMSRFGEVWVDHERRIREEWCDVVTEDDLVLIPGDVSWATTTKTIRKHLEEIASLPGRCVISPGNHDKWWKKVPKLQYDGVRFLGDAWAPLGDDWVLAATMGEDCPESVWWSAEAMQERFESACEKLETTLAGAAAEHPDRRILLMIHYPPRWAVGDTPTAFEQIIARFPVDLAVYGHIHGGDLVHAHNGAFDVGGRTVRYENASCDRIRMRPIHVADVSGSCDGLFDTTTH